jgi:CheY-like chemotaxis protein
MTLTEQPSTLRFPATTSLPTPPPGIHTINFTNEKDDSSSSRISSRISLPTSPPSTPAPKARKPVALGIRKSQRSQYKRRERYSAPVFRPCDNYTSCRPRMKVLLVDDNLINLNILSQTLRKHMAHMFDHLELAKSGVKALELLNVQSYDLILLDIDMPILNGIETARHIRQSNNEYHVLACNRTIPIVAVTTNDSADWKRAYYDAGMVSFTSQLLGNKIIIYIMLAENANLFFYRMDVLVSLLQWKS